jgi:DNA-binding MarR family transcriptional regulator
MIQIIASGPRLRILLVCWPTACTSSELKDALNLTPSAVRHHTRVLESANLLDRTTGGYIARSDWCPIVDKLRRLQVSDYETIAQQFGRHE